MDIRAGAVRQAISGGRERAVELPGSPDTRGTRQFQFQGTEVVNDCPRWQDRGVSHHTMIPGD